MNYKLEEHTALYSELDWEYNNVMSGPYENLSVRSDEGTIIAGLKDGIISGGWRPMVCVGPDKFQKLHIEALYDICRNFYYLDFLIDGKLSVISQFLLRHEHTARPYYTQIIDLTKTEEELHADLRKSYKSLCNSDDIDRRSTVNDLKLLHKKSRGGKTRPDKTWEIQRDMGAYVVMNKAKTAGIMIYRWRYYLYYACAASIGDAKIHHLLWYAISGTKTSWVTSKCTGFEMGEQVFSGDQKLVNISKFKRGFGGRTVTRLILEKNT